MALLESESIPMGSPAPDFSLRDTVSDTKISLADLQNGKGLAVCFICNHCPYVIHIQEPLVAVARDLKAQGLEFVAISANDYANYPDDAPDKMKARAQDLGFPFPYLIDEDQSVARAYRATCTPDLYIFDGDLKLYYHGQFDETRPGRGQAHGGDFRAAGEALLAGQPAPANPRPSIGCSIKWR